MEKSSMDEPNKPMTEDAERRRDQRPWHVPVMEIMPISMSEHAITTHSDGSASANS
jgi:hypothetical protein